MKQSAFPPKVIPGKTSPWTQTVFLMKALRMWNVIHVKGFAESIKHSDATRVNRLPHRPMQCLRPKALRP
eukprot:512504-Amphidinium_carterae.1